MNTSGKIGPHEDIEFELFEKNKKDLIYFSFDYQPENHEQIASKLGAKCLTFLDKEFKRENYIYYRKGKLAQAQELKEILTSGIHFKDDDWATKEHRIGELLGYTKADVELYIKKFGEHHGKNA
jgi:hypothetical protein